MDNEKTPTKGVIFYNRGTGCLARLIVAIRSLRKHYQGPATLFLEGDHPPELVEGFRKEFNIDIIFDNNPETTTYVRAVEICRKTPYDLTCWLDADLLVVGPIDEMLDAVEGYDIAIPHFALWRSDGPMISARIRDYESVVPQYMEGAVNYGPAINCGVYSFTKDTPFLQEWNWLAKQGEQIKKWDEKKQRFNTGIFIPDEKACQVLLHRYNTRIMPAKFNVSVIHDPNTEDKRIIHYHGRKHGFDVPLAHLWQEAFCECLEQNICGICALTHKDKANKRTNLWLRCGIDDRGNQSKEIGNSETTRELIYRANRAIKKHCPEALQGPCGANSLPSMLLDRGVTAAIAGGAKTEIQVKSAVDLMVKSIDSWAAQPSVETQKEVLINGFSHTFLDSPVAQKVTTVTACDEKYVELLQQTFPNWIRFKKIDQSPILVFVNGMEIADKRLDFLRIKPAYADIRLVRWERGIDGAPDTDDHRELMLSAFVLGTARHVKTPFWLKLDSDSFATDDRPLVKENDFKFAFIGHRWGYSWEKHIRALDNWAESRKDIKWVKPPMYPRGSVSGRRFYHNDRKRTISFVQLQSTEFTRMCANLAGNRLPAPSHDTYLFYLADRLDLPIGTDNYKKHRGFDQGKGLEGIVQRLQEVNILSMDYRRDFDLVQILPDDTKPIKLSVQETSSIRLI